MQQLLDALVQLDAVDLLRDGVLTAVEPQVTPCRHLSGSFTGYQCLPR